MEYATSKQVADFYDIEQYSLKNVIKRHREELESDGMVNKTKTDLLKLLKSQNDTLESVSIPNRGVNIFPKRAILRVGMLLRDSEVAKEVRTQLLNIEEHTATEVKAYEIDYEQEVLGRGFKVYGTVEEPLFLVKDVAEWIDYGTHRVGEMLKNVDEDEKLNTKISWSGQNRQMWFLTEDGIYEVLMMSRKPIAKQWKKEVELPEEGSSFVRSLQIYLVSYFET
ncbi:BRO-N domain-containing protein [Bacillus cereus]|uniref:BRO-N domain-containing protein n=1 Tax=Bacillus cereus TaxID=1396 RepID=UPI0039812D08